MKITTTPVTMTQKSEKTYVEKHWYGNKKVSKVVSTSVDTFEYNVTELGDTLQKAVDAYNKYSFIKLKGVDSVLYNLLKNVILYYTPIKGYNFDVHIGRYTIKITPRDQIPVVDDIGQHLISKYVPLPTEDMTKQIEEWLNDLVEEVEYRIRLMEE